MTQGLAADHCTTETHQIRPGGVEEVHAAAGGVGFASGRGAAQIPDPLVERGLEVIGPAGRLENRHAALDARQKGGGFSDSQRRTVRALMEMRSPIPWPDRMMASASCCCDRKPSPCQAASQPRVPW